MDSIIPSGHIGVKTIRVSADMTATKFGSGLVDVFATPAMIAFMETTALHSISSFLTETLTSVGTEVNIKHLRASPVGRDLRCESKVIEVNGKKIVFEVAVFDEDVLVGHGTHTRYVVDKEKFMLKL